MRLVLLVASLAALSACGLILPLEPQPISGGDGDNDRDGAADASDPGPDAAPKVDSGVGGDAQAADTGIDADASDSGYGRDAGDSGADVDAGDSGADIDAGDSGADVDAGDSGADAGSAECNKPPDCIGEVDVGDCGVAMCQAGHCVVELVQDACGAWQQCEGDPPTCSDLACLLAGDCPADELIGCKSFCGSSSTCQSGADDQDLDGVSYCEGDCEPEDPTIYLGHREVCGDGLDNDCDALTDGDNDGDGFACEPAVGQADCDDGDPLARPGDGPQDSCDGIDLGCDGFEEAGADACAPGVCGIECCGSLAEGRRICSSLWVNSNVCVPWREPDCGNIFDDDGDGFVDDQDYDCVGGISLARCPADGDVVAATNIGDGTRISATIRHDQNNDSGCENGRPLGDLLLPIEFVGDVVAPVSFCMYVSSTFPARVSLRDADECDAPEDGCFPLVPGCALQWAQPISLEPGLHYLWVDGLDLSFGAIGSVSIGFHPGLCPAVQPVL